jgi:hypothetical protein
MEQKKQPEEISEDELSGVLHWWFYRLILAGGAGFAGYLVGYILGAWETLTMSPTSLPPGPGEVESPRNWGAFTGPPGALLLAWLVWWVSGRSSRQAESARSASSRTKSSP